jgi:hypothetical protein
MFAPACEGWQRSADLSVEIEGIVTIYLKYYFKTSGCQGDRDADSDEKYYGSYFIEDESGGMFVLGDTKVAHFNMGQRVRLKVRAVKESFGLQMVIAHDVEEIGREVEPIYYQIPTGPLGFDEMARVQRVTGTVVSDASNFGELLIESDEGVTYSIKVDWEITRRKHAWDAGERIQVTGPVLYSYDIFFHRGHEGRSDLCPRRQQRLRRHRVVLLGPTGAPHFSTEVIPCLHASPFSSHPVCA